MPAPSTSLATLRPDLGGSMEEFDLAADRQGFIATRVLPVIESDVQSGTFGRIPVEQLLKNPEINRASRSGYSRGKWSFTDDAFATKEYGHEEPVDDRDEKIYGNYFDAEMVSAEIARDIVLRAAEKRVADLVFNATTYTGSSLTTAITNEWDDFANATPVDDVEAAIKKVWENTGLWANALIINRRVFRNLRQCDQVKDAIASQGAGSPTKASDITAEMLSRVFDLPNVVVAGGTRNSAKEGQTATMSPVWSDEYAMVCRMAETNSIKEPCLGRVIHWGKDGSQIGGTMETYRDETNRSDIVRCRHEVHEKLFYTECGHLLSNVTT
jgi:hypothetical protein